MKLLAYSEDKIQVSYFGVIFSVPSFGFITVNKWDSAFWHVERPEKISHIGFDINVDSSDYLGKVDLKGLSWEDSCRAVESLTRF